MKNMITASIKFSFKGINYTPSIALDIGKYLQSKGSVSGLYALIARENNIDLYSYEYEIMQAEGIQFNQAEGLVANFIVDGNLDIQAFESAWCEHTMLTQLQDIAKRHMAIDDLQQHSELEAALRETYRLGQDKTTN